MEEVIKLTDSSVDKVVVKLEYMNRCIHVKGELKGRLQGLVRKRKVAEVSNP